jgi:tight adherence protein C
MIGTPLFVAVAIFLFLAAAGYTFYLGMYGGHNALEDQLNDLAIKVRMGDGAFTDTDEEPPEGISDLLLQWAVRRMPAPKLDPLAGEKLSQTLSHAGFTGPGLVRIFQVIRMASIAAGILLAVLLSLFTGAQTTWLIVYVICGAIFGSFAPIYYLSGRARRRQVKLRRELSDILDLLVTCIESGLGIFEALRTVGREAERQGRLLGGELAILSAELTTGASLAQALRALAERTGVDDIKSVAAILIQSEKLGSQMAPALRACSDSLRVKRRIRAEEAAQKSTVKILFPLVLFILPAMLIVILSPALIQILHTLMQQQ